MASGNNYSAVGVSSNDLTCCNGVCWVGSVASTAGAIATAAITAANRPAPYTQLPNGAVITQSGQIVPGTTPGTSISATTLLLVLLAALLVFWLKP